MDRPGGHVFAWYWRMPLESVFHELWLAKRRLAQRDRKAEIFF